MSPRRLLLFACGALALVLTAPAGRAALQASQIVRHPAPSGPLAARLDWALAEAAKAGGAGKGFWIGYGIRREMGEYSQMGVNVSFNSTETSLEERIYGRRPAAERKLSTADLGSGLRPERGLEPGVSGIAERKAVREIAVLLRFSAPNARRPRTISACTMSAGVALEDVPLYWLGSAADDDSLRLLTAYYVPDAPVELRTAAVEAVALHRKPDIVVPFLERIVAGREPERIRAEAAEYLGDQPDARALEILKRTARADASLEVRKAAVSGMAEMELPAAFDALIDLALHERETKIRIEAIESLGEFHTPAASKALVAIIKGAK